MQEIFVELLGEVPFPSWFFMKFETVRSEQVAEFSFECSLRIDGHRRLMPKLPNDPPDEGMPTAQPDATSVGFSFGISERDLRRLSREELVYEVSRRSRETFMKGAFMLYEFDPRIGWTLDDGHTVLPKSPLLDPTTPFSRTGVAAVDERLFEGPVVESSCPFCGEEHTSPPIWAGANLLWVHPVCWRAAWD